MKVEQAKSKEKLARAINEIKSSRPIAEERINVVHLTPFPIFDLNFFGQMVMSVMFCRYSKISEAGLNNVFLVTRRIEERVPYGIELDEWVKIQNNMARLIGARMVFVGSSESDFLKSLHEMLIPGKTLLKTIFAGDNSLAKELVECESLATHTEALPKLMIELNVDADFALKRDKSNRRRFRKVVEKGAIMLAVSDEVAESYRKIVPDAGITVVRNGVDTCVYHLFPEMDRKAALESIGVGKGRKVVSFVARPDCYKGWQFVSHVLRHFEKIKRDDVAFIFAFSPTYSNQGCSSNKEKVDRVDRVKELFSGLKFLSSKGLINVVIDVSKYFHFDVDVFKMLNSTLCEKEVYDAKKELEENLNSNTFPLYPWYAGLMFIPVQGVSDILLHPSIHEAYGLAVREASMCGSYVVCSKTGALPSLIKEGENGTLVPIPEEVKSNRTRLDESLINDIGDKFLEALNRALLVELNRQEIYLKSDPENDNYVDTFAKTVKFIREGWKNA